MLAMREQAAKNHTRLYARRPPSSPEMVRALVLALALAGATGSDCPTETKVKSSASGEAQNVQLISELPTDALVQWVDQSGHEQDAGLITAGCRPSPRICLSWQRKADGHARCRAARVAARGLLCCHRRPRCNGADRVGD